MEKKNITETMRKSLRADFPSEAYSRHPTKTFLTTLKAMYITERLNDVFGVGRWNLIHKVIERTSDYVLIRGRFVSEDYDVIIPDQFGGHKTSGINTEIADGYKSAVTDCQSKIASYLEVGIEMFKGKVTIGKKEVKQSSAKSNSAPIPTKPWLNLGDADWKLAEEDVKKGGKPTLDKILAKVNISTVNKAKLEALIK